MESLRTLARDARAPIDRKSIDEKVEVFERRLNGRILPFLGVHGSLIALIYLLSQRQLADELLVVDPLLAAGVGLGVALLCALLVVLLHVLGRGRDSFGGAAVATCLAIIALLLAPFGLFAGPAALAVYYLLLALNAYHRVDDHEINTVWIYLPFIVFLIGSAAPAEQLAAAALIYAPAIYVKFRRQPDSNKLALGFSLLAYLALSLRDNSESKAVLGLIVIAVLLLFAGYAFRMRRLAGSSWRYFAADTIVAGLWAVLVGLLFGDSAESPQIVWGLGIAAYQGLFYLSLKNRKALPEVTEGERGARLAWLQIAFIAVFFMLVAEDLGEALFGAENLSLALLLLAAPFIPLYVRLRSSFLAFATRLWIALALFVTLDTIGSDLERNFLNRASLDPPAEVRADLLDGFGVFLGLALLAYVVGLAATLRVDAIRAPAWWRGLIRGRHLVLARRGLRLVVDNANRIVFVGGIISAIAGLFNWFRYAGSDRRGVSSRDVLQIGVHVYALAMTLLFARYLLHCCTEGQDEIFEAALFAFAAGDRVFVAACCAWGVVLYLLGVVRRDHLARFFATGFVALPLATFGLNNAPDDAGFLAFVVLLCGFSLFAFGLLRRAVA